MKVIEKKIVVNVCKLVRDDSDETIEIAGDVAIMVEQIVCELTGGNFVVEASVIED